MAAHQLRFCCLTITLLSLPTLMIIKTGLADRTNDISHDDPSHVYGTQFKMSSGDVFTDPWSKVLRELERWTGPSKSRKQRHHDGDFDDNSPKAKEFALQSIYDIATDNTGSLCDTDNFRALPVFLPEVMRRFEDKRKIADMAANLIEQIGINHDLLSALFRALIDHDESVLNVRAIAFDPKTADVIDSLSWHASVVNDRRIITRLKGPTLGRRLKPEPWFRPAMSSRGDPMPTRANHTQRQTWWSLPYYSCAMKTWLITYGVDIPPFEKSLFRGFLGVDFDLSEYDVNQCDEAVFDPDNQLQVTAFLGTHKCHNDTSDCEFQSGMRWSRGAYRCHCRQGYYSDRPNIPFNGSLVEVAWGHERDNESSEYEDMFRCRPCSTGCQVCSDSSPCLASYNWPFRIALLTFSSACIASTVGLVGYMYQYRKIKVFKVASPIFLGITLLGCAIMYLEMAAIFPVLGLYSCIATKWTRHMGFCITYTALLMKTWRVSLTYRVKSAHKVKLTDKQLLQWMFPILLVMLIYLGTWTLGSPPNAEDIRDSNGLIFKQCTYNWWDHSLAIGEVLFLGWGIKVCLNVRNAESLFNEARLISYAIYNIALVNIAMVAFHLFIFPTAGPDIKYLLGFMRTQLSTTVTIGLVFGPKVIRVMKGQGDQYDNRARAKGVTASFSLNGIGLTTDETTDLYQENEELKEEIQKLAAQIEFMKIVHMETNNRHVKPKPGGFFNGASATSPVGKGSCSTGLSIPPPPRQTAENIQQIPTTPMSTSVATTTTSAICCVTSPADTLSERV
ncbi:probable G-protein coupled receptor CG31760 [Ischnura elegans]|uniref:probable G-protein coupled receptor CG31760 n=1 Tax=Ischnura elegans TaxID=197161 RepID=UPI001ED8787F|nr:probable G-protein coupled receptor CG31760 [Ischnura elegans]